ncbi:MAG: TonB-dependent receptor [Gammaproteobacteria bacterium]|nr:MAG: TonB-dependent receptor [Gammaproteobacteria bacterium]
MKHHEHSRCGPSLLLTLACGATLAAAAASAQEREVFTGLGEIIVTATKQAESLQDVGLSITAVSSVDLEQMGATDFLDFAVRVPNLGMAYEADGRFDSSSPSVRGVFGSNTTGVYFDDTPVNASILPRVMDLDRIEVLRGPQGTLYGAKSMGGTIRFITKQPDLHESESAVHTTLSTVKEGDQNWGFDGSFNIPLVEGRSALRVAAYFGQNSGIFDREYQSDWVDFTGAPRQNSGPAFATKENVDDEEFYGGQVVGKFTLTDNVSLSLRVMGQKVEADGMPFADIDPDNTTQLRFFDSPEPGSDRWYVLSGTLNWDVASGEIVSATSWYNRKTSEWEEEAHFLHFLFDQVIGIPIDPLESVINTTEKYESFVQEIRYSSQFDGAFNFIAGAFYQDLEWDHLYPPAVQTGLADAIDAFTETPGLGQNCEYGFCLTDDDLIYSDHMVHKTKELAFFGEATWEFGERWALTLGGRWYDNEVDAVNFGDGFANSGPSMFDRTQSESGFNPKALLQVDATDNVNVYASAAKGFRIGGVNGNVPELLCGPELDELGIEPSNATTYDSDSLWSYELGMKSTLADNRMTLNGALFYIDWSDIQQMHRLACGFQFTSNAGQARSQGFELELMAAPMDGLTLSAGVGYTDAEITDAGSVPGVNKGDKIQGVPDWTFTSSAQYQWPLASGRQGMVRGDFNYYGDSFSANNATSSDEQRLREAWTALNLRAGLVDERWELLLFVDNVTDERANLADSRSIAAETPTRPRLVVNRPRTIGLEARMRF